MLKNVNVHLLIGTQRPCCLAWSKQSVLDPHHKFIDEKTQRAYQKNFARTHFPKGHCRVYEWSMLWLLEFIDSLIGSASPYFNALVVTEDHKLEVMQLEGDKLWSYVGT